MPHQRSTFLKQAAALALAFASVGAQAAVTTYFASQGPKPDLSSPTPPPLSTTVQGKIDEFNSKITLLGGNEFDPPAGAASLDFTYTGGSATVVGNPSLPRLADGADNTTFPFAAGRFNTTPGLPDDAAGNPNWGHWLEANSSFSYIFSTAISAFSFLGTDFYDFSGTLAFDIFNGNSLVDRVTVETQNDDLLNGNLIFFGLTSTTGFDRINFNIASPGNNDYLGFDSIVVGQAIAIDPGTLPEPGSIALVGLALLGLAGSQSLRRR